MQNQLSIKLFKKIFLYFLVIMVLCGGLIVDSTFASSPMIFINPATNGGSVDSPFSTQPVFMTSGGAVVTATLASGTGSLTGSTTITAFANGLARFSDLGYSKSGEPFSIRFSTPPIDLTGDLVVNFSAMTPGVKTQLAWGTQPIITIYTDAILTPFTIKVLDQYGNQVSTSGDTVTIAGTGLSGTLSATTVNGLATFSNVSITAPGTITIVGALSGVTSTSNSNLITIYRAPSTVALSASSTLAVGSTTVLTATIKDSINSIVTNDNTNVVSFALLGNGGTLSSLSVRVVNGIATTTLTRIGAGALTTTATVTGLTSSNVSYSIIAPTNLIAGSANGTINNFNWTYLTGSSTIIYNIYRSISAGLTATAGNLIGTSTSATYADSDTSAFISYYYNVAAVDGLNNISSLPTELQLCPTKSISNGTINASCTIICSAGYSQSGNSCVVTPSQSGSSGGGGGGGGGGSVANNMIIVPVVTVPSITTPMETKPIVSPEPKITDDKKALPTDTKDVVTSNKNLITNINQEVSVLSTSDVNNFLATYGYARNATQEKSVMNKYINKLIVGQSKLDDKAVQVINSFISYGTPTTQVLGVGERAGTVSSFKSSFGKLPTTDQDWQDVVKIANGRWPNQRNLKVENAVTKIFKAIYLREPNIKNPKDDAAIVVMAYGLRPANRNVDSEKKATKTFQYIFGGIYPNTATDWDIVRAIAYSGATR
ncbi:MAG: Ig-like domain-containing protein [Candidatus Falkowbacteria bacterium]|nr:Ig-like domain-containing protein [Candidatus Falkowbacteria bacterium]